MNQTFTCAACGHLMSARLAMPWIITCPQCHGILHQHSAIKNTLTNPGMPPDWSFIRIGSSFQYAEETFEVIGRIRLQLRNDYKNFWCGVQRSNTHVWLMESFASIAVMSATWKPFNQKVKKLHAGSSFTAPGGAELTGEYVEKCEALNIEGEIGEWLLLRPGFFFIQGSNNDHHTAIFTIDDDREIASLQGWKIDVDQLKLTNILVWNEWK